MKLILLIRKHRFYLNLSISNNTISTKIYNKWTISTLLLLISLSLMVMSLDELLMECMSPNLFVSLVHFSVVETKPWLQSYCYHKAYSKFYRRNSGLVDKYNVRLMKRLKQGILEPKFYCDLVYRFRKILEKSTFSVQFRKLVNRLKIIGYNLDIMRQTACLIVNPITVYSYVFLFNCTGTVRVSDSMTAPR